MKLCQILFTLFNILSTSISYIPNAVPTLIKETQFYSSIILDNNLHCHLISSRIKTFSSSINKLNKINCNELYDLHDLIGFRFVFYDYVELYKFYHYIKKDRNILHTKNFIKEPKHNNYKALNIRYSNPYNDCPIKQMECQVYFINDYYESIYGISKYHKNYTLLL